MLVSRDGREARTHGTDLRFYNVPLLYRTTYRCFTCTTSHGINRDEKDPKQIGVACASPLREDAGVTTASSVLSVLSNLNEDLPVVLPRNRHLVLLAKARLRRGPREKMLMTLKKLQAPVSLSSVQF